ncbi:MAG: flagellar hook-basal body complex protein FliE [Pseudomonadota bacterium]
MDTRINELMSQMQALTSRASAAVTPQTQGLSDEGVGAAGAVDFGAMLKASIDAVNATQMGAGTMVERFETGDPQMELGEVMVALQKADISFKAMTEVRNKLVDAYQEIMNMPL